MRPARVEKQPDSLRKETYAADGARSPIPYAFGEAHDQSWSSRLLAQLARDEQWSPIFD